MKKIRLYLKRIALLLIFLMTLQSCSIYYTKTASVDEALLSDNKVKIITTTNDIYKFKKLQTEDDQIYGVLKQRTTKAENLLDQGLLEDYDDKYGKLLLSQDAIQAIHLKNKGASTAVTVAIPVVIVGVLVGIGVHSANNISVSWGE
jgi:hypothetical protein